MLLPFFLTGLGNMLRGWRMPPSDLVVYSFHRGRMCFYVPFSLFFSFQLLTGQQQMQDATMTESKGTTTTTTSSASSSPGSSSVDPDAISWLRSTLHSVDQRCSSLQTDLKKAQQVLKQERFNIKVVSPFQSFDRTV